MSDCRIEMGKRDSETCLKRPLKIRQNKGMKDMWYLNAGQTYCRMLHNSATLLTCIKRLTVLKPYFGLLSSGSLRP